jgi:hypothetical protein
VHCCHVKSQKPEMVAKAKLAMLQINGKKLQMKILKKMK